jgi:hypothetical protein
MPEKDPHNYGIIIAIIASFLTMMGFNFKWIQSATSRDHDVIQEIKDKKCVLKPDCTEDRQALIAEVRLMRKENREDMTNMSKENKAEFQRLYDKMEKKKD